MRTIRRKIYFVVVMLAGAIAVGIVICVRTPPSITPTNKASARNGTIIFNYRASSLGGEKLFKTNCTSCHMMANRLNSPTLIGVEDRVTDTLLKSF